MHIPELPSNPTAQDRLNRDKLVRRDQALLSARKAAKPNKGRMGGPADFSTPFAFGSHEQREVIRGGFFLSAPILTEDECASIVDSANKMPPPGSVKRARFGWRKAGTFGVGNLFISNAVPHMTWAIFDRLKALLLSQPVSLLPEHLTRLSLEWDTFSLAANSENSTTYQEIHTDESDSGLNLNDLCLNGSRGAVTIALEKGCSFGVARDGLNGTIIDVPVGCAVLFSTMHTAHFGTQRKAMRMMVLCAPAPKQK